MVKLTNTIRVATLLGAAICAPITAVAARYHVAEVVLDVAVWREKAWDFLEYFCQLVVEKGERSTCIVGHGEVGSIRERPDGTHDLLVAKGPFYYTYQTITGEEAELDYHVTIQVLPVDDLNSTAVATLIWDEEPVPANQRLSLQYRYATAIRQVLYDAKVAAEAS